MNLEKQLRNDAQLLRELGWFNRATMMSVAADDIHRMNERIKRMEEAGDKMADLLDGGVFMKLAVQWHEAKEDKP